MLVVNCSRLLAKSIRLLAVTWIRHWRIELLLPWTLIRPRLFAIIVFLSKDQDVPWQCGAKWPRACGLVTRLISIHIWSCIKSWDHVFLCCLMEFKFTFLLFTPRRLCNNLLLKILSHIFTLVVKLFFSNMRFAFNTGSCCLI